MKNRIFLLLVFTFSVLLLVSCSPSSSGSQEKKTERTYDSLELLMRDKKNAPGTFGYNYVEAGKKCTDKSEFFEARAQYSAYPTWEDVAKDAKIYAQKKDEEQAIEIDGEFSFASDAVYSVWAEYNGKKSSSISVKGVEKNTIFYCHAAAGSKPVITGTAFSGIGKVTVAYIGDSGEIVYSPEINFDSRVSEGGNYILKVVQCDKDGKELSENAEFKADTDKIQKECARLKISLSSGTDKPSSFVDITVVDYSECNTGLEGGCYKTIYKGKAPDDTFWFNFTINYNSKKIREVRSSFDKAIVSSEGKTTKVLDGWKVEILKNPDDENALFTFTSGQAISFTLTEAGTYHYRVTCLQPEKILDIPVTDAVSATKEFTAEEG